MDLTLLALGVCALLAIFAVSWAEEKAKQRIRAEMRRDALKRGRL